MSAGPRGGKTRQYALGYLAQVLSFAIPLVYNLVFPILLGPAAFGTLTIANGVTYLILALVEPGLVAAMIARTAGLSPDAGRARRRTFRTFGALRLSISAAAAGAIWISAPVLAEAYGLQGRVTLIRLAGLLLVSIGIYSVLDTSLIALQRNELSVAVRTVSNAVCLGAPLAAWWAGRTPEAVLLGSVSGFAVAALFAGALILRGRILSGDQPPGEDPGPGHAEALRAAAEFSGLYFAVGMQTWGVVALAGFFVPAASVGYLKISVGVMQAAVTLAPVPAFVVLSYLVSLRHDAQGFRRYFRRIVRLVALFAPAIVAGSAVLSHRAVAVLYGPAYAGVAPLLVLIGISYPALVLLQPSFQALVVLEGRGRTLVAFLALILLEGLGAVILLKLAGTTGAAALLAASPYLFLAWTLPRLARQGLDLSPGAFARSLPAAGALALAGAGCLALIPGLAGLLAGGLLGVGIYAAVLWLTGGIDRDLLTSLRRLLPGPQVPPDQPTA